MDFPHLLTPELLHAARNRGGHDNHRQHHHHLKVRLQQQQRKHQLCGSNGMPVTSPLQGREPVRDPFLSYQTPNNNTHTWTNTNTGTRTLPSSTILANTRRSNGAPQRRDAPGGEDAQREIGQFFIQSIEYPRGHFFVTPKPEEISHPDPPIIKRPCYPEMRRHSLDHFEPCIFFVQYPCRAKCRSLGICVHYQFVIPCGKCPDGLICSECIQGTSPQERIMATRKCPLHQDPNQPNPIGNRMEDFLATEAQKVACEEILFRSRTGQWEDLPVPSLLMNDNWTGQQPHEEEDYCPRVEGQERWCDDNNDNNDNNNRERTPRNFDDVQMLDSTTIFDKHEHEERDLDFGLLDQKTAARCFQPIEKEKQQQQQKETIKTLNNNNDDDMFSFDVFGGPMGMQSFPCGLS
ncbi:uncharacterized protein PV06_00710 [Exophiala oligosperma]|uniref:Uncharacterized protein n=1 Tax=Exophiala oligosperma TaxID=215243 RepID=A0A0D2DZX4_9EURO|nr:uncharacterized protein PV06_00710 [Exophiala oligosperma]KIW48090.1 hypothetical protein PV06_00710 [Exophiala oligosperma]